MSQRDCGFVNEDLECLGCGYKMGCVDAGLYRCPYETVEQQEARRKDYEERQARRSSISTKGKP